MVHVVAIATALACRDMVDNTEANQHDDAGADGDVRRLGDYQAHGMGVNCLTVHVWTTGSVSYTHLTLPTKRIV